MGVRWMMSAGEFALRPVRWCVRIATTDYCPNWNRYLRSLYRPVGWLPLAAGISAVLASVVAPALWMIVGGLLGLWFLGLLWPLLGMAGVAATWQGRKPQQVEGEPIRIRLQIKNRCPLPLFGLSVITGEQNGDEADSPPPLALSQVGAWTQSGYELNWRVPVIGWVPGDQPLLECGFPFDVYRCRKSIRVEQPTLVVPWSIDLNRIKQPEVRGAAMGFGRTGTQPGREGELTGLRPLQDGDSWRQIHWSQSARQGKWIVRQGGLPTRPEVRLSLTADDPDRLSLPSANQRLLRRWLASVGRTFLSQGVQVAIHCQGDWVSLGQSSHSLARLLERLATCDLRELIASDSWINRQPGAEEAWLFSVSGAGGGRLIRGAGLGRYQVLPLTWTKTTLPEFNDLESELQWCQDEFISHWQASFDRENHYATA